MEHTKSDDSETQINTPKSARENKKAIHLKKLLSMNIELLETEYKTFVVGICGGDCAGKREMIQYMFENINETEWKVRETGQLVTIVSQAYFVNVADGVRYSSAGTNWEQFYKKTLSLIVGNQVQIQYTRDEQLKKIKVKPAKLLIIEGSHIFMTNEVTHNLSSLFNLKVFIDSDSDVRLSRRVYQDTQQKNKDLNWSITNYLQYIKPSYQKQIEPLKQISDIIIPHFGGGFNDHKKTNRHEYDSNIKNACSLILTHLKEQMRKYQQQMGEEQ